MKTNTKIILIITALAVFLATFNETFLNLAFSTISKDWGIDFSVVQWLATGYMLGASIMVPISAFVYRRIPTKFLFLGTVSLFIIGSIICGLSTSFVMLLIGRIIQALGSGLLIPIAMNVIVDIAPKEKLGSYMGIMGAMTTLGPSLSLVIAGALLSVAEWHILFGVFCGLSVILFVLALLFLGNVAKLGKPRLDTLSVILIALALIGILYAISSIFTYWWIALISFAVGIVFLTLSILRQKKIAEPLINLAPFKTKVFDCGIVLNIITLMLLFAFNIVLPYVLAERGVSVLTSSLIMFPAIFLSCIVAPLAGRCYDKFGTKYILPIGMTLMMVFAILLAFFISSPSVILIAVLYIPFVIGTALVIGPAQSHALYHLDHKIAPHGVTIFSTGFQIAGCIGASLFSNIYSATATTTTYNRAFLLVGLIVAGFALIGLILTLIINKISQPKNSATTTPTPLDHSVSSIMLTPVYTITKTATVLDAMRLFVDKKISSCPIVDENGTFVGFISDGDIFRFLATKNTNFTTVYSFLSADVLNNEPIDTKLREYLFLPALEIAFTELHYLTPNQDLATACQILATTHKKKVVVLDDNKIVGVVTRSAITKLLMRYSIRAIEKENQL